MKISFSHIFFYWVWILGMGDGFAQTIVGMGTESPNPNAVLELVSESLDQGFLVPRFTTAQRTASGFISKLTNKDNGLLVFDTSEGEFYYWYGGAWQQGIATGSLKGIGTVWYTGAAAPRNNEGKNGDFYIHTLSGDVYKKENGTVNVIGNMLKTTLNDGKLLVGNASNIATPVTVSGDATLANDGTVSVVGLQGRQMATTAPSNGNVLTRKGGAWEAQMASGSGSGATWFEGLAVPIGGNPAGAMDGDYYFKTDTENFYRKESGSWVAQGKWFHSSGGRRRYHFRNDNANSLYGQWRT